MQLVSPVMYFEVSLKQFEHPNTYLDVGEPGNGHVDPDAGAGPGKKSACEPRQGMMILEFTKDPGSYQ
jgi:hypothetical protein